MSPSAKHLRRLDDERGSSLLQIIVVLAIAGVIAGMAVVGIRAARAEVRLSNSARAFAQVAEKARLDAIRRRTTTHIEFTDSDKYEVSMDFNGTGTAQTRSFTLDSGVVITDSTGTTLTAASDSLPYTDFDWRGRTFDCNALFNFKNDRSDKLTVQVAGSGDISVNSAITVNSNIAYTSVSATADVNPSAILSGTDSKCNLTPCGVTADPTACGAASGGGTGTTSGTSTCTAGTLTTNTTYISDLKRSGGNTRTVTVTVSAAGTISAVPASNLSATPGSSTTITSSSGGSVTYTLRSLTKSMGTFNVKFSFSNCSPVTVNVKVIK